MVLDAKDSHERVRALALPRPGWSENKMRVGSGALREVGEGVARLAASNQSGGSWFRKFELHKRGWCARVRNDWQ